MALVGLALALLYTLNSWSIHASRGMTELQPAQSRNIEESSVAMETAPERQSANKVVDSESKFQLAVRSGDGPGFFSLAAAAVAPWYSADSGVIRNALVLLLSFVFLGGVIAIVAHRADPRVYIASDVEQLLGFKPMAQLPDFTEVANNIAEDHLSRLASAIESAVKDHRFTQCVFTGTGPEVGVTTVVTHLQKLLETEERPAVITNAASNSKLLPGITEDWTHLDEGRQGIVLVDAAPLSESEETVRLVRSAHSTIVVIQSGVTTRAELRTVANILQRAKAPAVGFVLNRVRLATADPAFRRSIKKSKRQLHQQGQAANWQMLKTLEQAIEEGRASLDIDVAAPPVQPAVTPEKIAANGSPLNDQSFRANGPIATDHAGLAVVADGKNPQSSLRALPAPASERREEIPSSTRNEIPSPLAEIAAQFDELVPEARAERGQFSLTAPRGENGNRASYEPSSPAPEKTAHVSLPRLSELRGMRFSQALRDLDHARHPAQPSAEIETLMSAIAPFESMFTAAEPASSLNGDSPDATSAGLELPPALRALLPILESEISSQAINGAAVNGNGDNANRLTSNPHASKPGTNTKNNGHRGEKGERSGPEQNGSGPKPGSFFEQLQILPSRRGQYKKKS